MEGMFFFGIFGLIVGSFLNVLILRYGIRDVSGRSACMSCVKPIPWFDLIPVFSWLHLGGRCRFCRSKISPQYPLVELATAILFALVGASPLSITLRFIGLLMISVLIPIIVYDIRHTIIPDTWVWIFNALAFASVFLPTLWSGPRLFDVGVFTLAFPLQATSYWLPTLLAGPFSALPLFALWLISRGRWMGLGDVKLALGIGWLLGPVYGIAAVFFSFIIGAATTVPILFLSSPFWQRISARITPMRASRKTASGLTIHSEVPFGPFLIASCLLIWFLLAYGVPIPLI